MGEECIGDPGIWSRQIDNCACLWAVGGQLNKTKLPETLTNNVNTLDVLERQLVQ